LTVSTSVTSVACVTDEDAIVLLASWFSWKLSYSVLVQRFSDSRTSVLVSFDRLNLSEATCVSVFGLWQQYSPS